MKLFEPSSGYSHIQEIAEDITLAGYDTQNLMTCLLEGFIAVDGSKIND